MITFEPADQYTERRARDDAFAEALIGLFKRHPLPEHAHAKHHAVRGSALRKARAGGYADYAPGGMVYWRRQVMENAREDWNVPLDEVVTVHALIYG